MISCVSRTSSILHLLTLVFDLVTGQESRVKREDDEVYGGKSLLEKIKKQIEEQRRQVEKRSFDGGSESQSAAETILGLIIIGVVKWTCYYICCFGCRGKQRTFGLAESLLIRLWSPGSV